MGYFGISNTFFDESGRTIDVFDPKDFNIDPEYSLEKEYAGYAVKRDDVVLTERFKYENEQRRVF